MLKISHRLCAAKLSKEEVNYRRAPQCALCSNFINNGEGLPKLCKVVQGVVLMPDLCDKFARR